VANDGESLKEVREKLAELDRELVRLLGKRLRLVEQVALRKAHELAALRDPQREREVLFAVEAAAREERVDAWAVRQIFREILAMSVRFQERVLLSGGGKGGKNLHRCAFQGSPWAYSHLAAQKYFGAQACHMEFLGFPTFAACVAAVETGEAGWAVLPIENTTAGSINETYDLLRHTELRIVGEEVLEVNHCLLGLPGAALTGIRKVLSHPQALAQCRGFLGTLPGVSVEAFVDTAEAALEVSRRQDPALAAIASREAGEAFGLQVLAQGIADQPENWTRFVVVAAFAPPVPASLKAKTSLVLTTPHRQGALASCLEVLARRGINLTKLESRPVPNRPWEYMFYLDLEGSVTDPAVAEAVATLEAMCPFFKLLGSYPARTGLSRDLDSGAGAG